MPVYFVFVVRYALLSFFLLWFLFSLTFVIAHRLSLWKIVDITWGLGFVVIVLTGWGIFWQFQWVVQSVLVLLVVVWGLRLSVYLGIRSYKTEEDARYVDLKENHHSLFKAYINIFLSQALLSWIMCIPFYFYLPLKQEILSMETNLNILWIGTTISVVGLIWEWTADFQINYFKKPKKLVTEGLWKYSRHPNYFGEILFWWGIWVGAHLITLPKYFREHYYMAIAGGLLALISPLTITLIISFLTGPMLEKQMSHYEKWEAYKKKTPYIFPFRFD